MIFADDWEQIRSFFLEKALKSVLRFGVILVVSMMLSGCNWFDPMDTSLFKPSGEDRLTQGNLALNSGDFSRAQEIFQDLYVSNTKNPPFIIGFGETLAGIAGYQELTILNLLQNSAANTDRAPVTFRTAKTIRDRAGLEKAVALLMTNPQPTQADRLTRGLMRLAAAVCQLLDAYDTNHDGKLNSKDQINFDGTILTPASWTALYQDLITGPSTPGATLEQTYLDLVSGFDGRGAAWAFVTPVNGAPASGTFSPANKATILAVGDLAERLKTANSYYQVHAASFAEAIADLDGAN